MSMNSIMQQEKPHVRFAHQPFFRPILVAAADPGKFHLARGGVEPRGDPQPLARSEFGQWSIGDHGRRTVTRNQGDMGDTRRREAASPLADSAPPPFQAGSDAAALGRLRHSWRKTYGLDREIWIRSVHTELCRGKLTPFAVCSIKNEQTCEFRPNWRFSRRACGMGLR